MPLRSSFICSKNQLDTRPLIGCPSESTNQRPGYKLTYASNGLAHDPAFNIRLWGGFPNVALFLISLHYAVYLPTCLQDHAQEYNAPKLATLNYICSSIAFLRPQTTPKQTRLFSTRITFAPPSSSIRIIGNLNPSRAILLYVCCAMPQSALKYDKSVISGSRTICFSVLRRPPSEPFGLKKI